MSTPLGSAVYPTDPTMPTAAPAGYVTPTTLASPSKLEPPLTSAEIAARRTQFYELILRQIVQALTGFFLPAAGSAISQLASTIPVIGPLVSSITGIVGGTIGTIANFFTNLTGIGGSGGFLNFNLNQSSSTFNPISAAVDFIGGILNSAASLGGLFTGGLIPGLDGSKLVSGIIASPITGMNVLAAGLGAAGTPGGVAPPPDPTYLDAAAYAGYLSQMVAQHDQVIAATQAWIGGQQGRDDANNGVGGVIKRILLTSGSDGDALPALGFSSTGPTSGDLCIRGGRPFVGIKASKGVGTYFAILNYSYTGDNQTLEISAQDQSLYSGCATTLYTHCDTSHTVGAYLRIFNDHLEMGKFTRSGATYIYTPFTGGTYTPGGPRGVGGTVALRNSGTSWTIQYNREDVLTVVDATVTFDSSHRKAAISMQRANAAVPFDNFPAGNYDSFRTAMLTASDLVIPTFAGSGAKMQRTTSTDVNMPNTNATGSLVLPTSFFETTSGSVDITADLTAGSYTVSISARYLINLRIESGTSQTTGFGAMGTALFKNGTIVEFGPQSSGPLSSGFPFQSTHTIYLVAGDYVQAGYVNTPSDITGGFNGADGTGRRIYFDIAMMTQNLR